MSPSIVSTISFHTFYNIIDGNKRRAVTFHNGVNPATKATLWDVPIATKQDVDDAVTAGERGFKKWSQTPIETRKSLMNDFVALYTEYEEQFTSLLCAETGKPRSFAAAEVAIVKDIFTHHAALNLPVEEFEDHEKTVTTSYVPLGIVGAICPWNFPLTLSTGKIAPAILSGCTIIVKPSPFTPYTALKFVELAQEIFPPGVIQVVGGDDALGPWIVEHPGISKISFTGSTVTGKRVMAACANSLKRVTLELGGNDPCIVLPDVDFDKAVPEVVLGCFWNSAQVCVATKRVYIHQSIYREFVNRMVAFTSSLKVGAPDDPDVVLGPVQNQMQYERVKTFFGDSQAKGYKFALGKPNVAPSKGFFIKPTIIDNPPDDSRIVQEEPFGPIVPVQPWSELDEVIARANNTKAGLSASVWTSDVAQGKRVAARLESGSVYINSFSKPVPEAYFGGHKESGIGGEWGSTGVLAYCNAKAVHVYK